MRPSDAVGYGHLLSEKMWWSFSPPQAFCRASRRAEGPSVPRYTNSLRHLHPYGLGARSTAILIGFS